MGLMCTADVIASTVLLKLWENGIMKMVISWIRGPWKAPLRDIRLRNLGDLDFDLSRSMKVKYKGAIGLPVYGFLLMFNSNIGPNSALLQDIRLQHFL